MTELETQLSDSQSALEMFKNEKNDLETTVGKLQKLNQSLKERFATFKKNENEMVEHIDKLETEMTTHDTSRLVFSTNTSIFCDNKYIKSIH